MWLNSSRWGRDPGGLQMRRSIQRPRIRLEPLLLSGLLWFCGSYNVIALFVCTLHSIQRFNGAHILFFFFPTAIVAGAIPGRNMW